MMVTHVYTSVLKHTRFLCVCIIVVFSVPWGRWGVVTGEQLLMSFFYHLEFVMDVVYHGAAGMLTRMVQKLTLMELGGSGTITFVVFLSLPLLTFIASLEFCRTQAHQAGHITLRLKYDSVIK